MINSQFVFQDVWNESHVHAALPVFKHLSTDQEVYVHVQPTKLGIVEWVVVLVLVIENVGHLGWGKWLYFYAEPNTNK